METRTAKERRGPHSQDPSFLPPLALNPPCCSERRKKPRQRALTQRSQPQTFGGGAQGLFPSDFPTGPGAGGGVERHWIRAEAPGDHGNVGPTSCAAMATGSPTGPGWCPSERAGGALLGEKGGRKMGGDDEGLSLSCHPHPRPPRPWFPSLPVPYLEGVTSHDKATSTRPRSSRHTPTARPSGRRPRGPGVYCTVNTLRPARCPRKCWATSKPRPTLPLAFSGIVRRRPPWLR